MENYNIDPTISYDVVELPSKGIFYSNNKKSLRVAYLTASDENILVAPNLLQSDTVIEELLKRKILDKDFNIDELVDEDRQAILIFLRNTAFGSEYEMEMIDSKTNLPFKFTLDLSILKVKDFNDFWSSFDLGDYFMPRTEWYILDKDKDKFISHIDWEVFSPHVKCCEHFDGYPHRIPIFYFQPLVIPPGFFDKNIKNINFNNIKKK